MSGSRSLALVFACALLTPVAAAAEPQWGIPRPQGSNGTYGTQTAYNEGYTRGVRAGDNDARRGDPFQYVDESDYRRGDAGYQSQYGSRDRYRDEFRRGYVTGYRDGFERISYGGYGGYGVPGTQTGNLPPWSNGRGRAVGRGDRNDLAWNNGFNDGYEQGLNDGRDRHRNDPYAESRFRDGDRGYNSRYGSRDVYRNAYRDAFVSGYQRGYQEGWRYNRPY